MKDHHRKRKIVGEVWIAAVILVGLAAWCWFAEMAGGEAISPTSGTLPAGPGSLFVANFREARIRGLVSRVRTDMRALAVAIEAYYVDNDTYPAFAVGAKSVNGALGKSYPASALPSFRLPEALAPDEAAILRRTVRFATLTTPIGYLPSYPLDPFTSGGKAVFVYWTVIPGSPDTQALYGKNSKVGGVGWMLVSPGPDGDYEMAGEWDAYDPTRPQPSQRLLSGTNKKGHAFTYDPTNGILSHGDICWRVRM